MLRSEREKEREAFFGDAYSLSAYFRNLRPHMLVPAENGTHVND